MPRLSGDIPYRLLGAGQPTIGCAREGGLLVNPQSQDFHASSVIFNGVDDAARIPSDSNLSITNAFTVVLWVRGSDLENNVNTQTLFQIASIAGSNTNRFDITLNPAVSGFDFINFRLFNSSGVLIKRYQATSDIFFGDNDIWSMISVTWDGSVLSMYRNGENQSSNVNNITDIAGSQTNTNRSMSIGSKVDFSDLFSGRFHQVAVWNRALTQTEIRTIWNHGSGSRVNLQVGHDSYNGQNDLVAWYKIGRNPENPVADFTPNNRNMVSL